MARHAGVDLVQVIYAEYSVDSPDRLSSEGFERMRADLAQHGVRLRAGADGEAKLASLRALYEPYLDALGRRLSIIVPPWMPEEYKKDNWQSGPWDRAIQARSLQHATRVVDNHF